MNPKTAADGIEKGTNDMIANYEKMVEEKSGKLAARIAAQDVRTLVKTARLIEMRAQACGQELRFTWSTITPGLILRHNEKLTMNFDNTESYITRVLSHIEEFFEYLREEKGLQKPNPATEALRIIDLDRQALQRERARRAAAWKQRRAEEAKAAAEKRAERKAAAQQTATTRTRRKTTKKAA